MSKTTYYMPNLVGTILPNILELCMLANHYGSLEEGDSKVWVPEVWAACRMN